MPVASRLPFRLALALGALLIANPALAQLSPPKNLPPETAPTDSFPPDPTPTDPAVTDPAPIDPATTDRTATDPAVADPAAPAAAIPASALSSLLGKSGLAAAEAELAALPNPVDAERFALGGVRFLSAIEGALQARWKVGAEPVEYAPVLRLPLPPNPNPAPFDAATIETVFTGMAADLEASRAALAGIGEGADFGMAIDLKDLWFDIDGDGARHPEGLEDAAGVMIAAGLAGPETDLSQGLVVRFDAADAAWLAAYAHLLSALSEFALSLDPTAAIAATAAGWEAEATFGSAMMADALGAPQAVDQVAPLLLMLQATPDAARTTAALGHLEGMIAQNRRFWALVRAETDNEAEWIPNPSQASAVGGTTISAEVAASWEGVLAELEAMLKGELLIPHWRYGPAEGEGGETVGIDLRKVLTEPGTMDPILWAQGAAAAPYLKKGPLVSGLAFQTFSEIVQGDAALYALWLN